MNVGISRMVETPLILMFQEIDTLLAVESDY